MHEKALFYQSQVAVTLRDELLEIELQIEKAVESREGALAQARTADKAELAKALYLALESLRQAKVDKEQELLMATKQASLAQEELQTVETAAFVVPPPVTPSSSGGNDWLWVAVHTPEDPLSHWACFQRLWRPL